MLVTLTFRPWSIAILRIEFDHRWIDLFDEKEVINKRVDYLKDRHWIDKQTMDVTFSLLFYNGQVEPLVCEALLTFDFSRGMRSMLLSLLLLYSLFVS